MVKEWMFFVLVVYILQSLKDLRMQCEHLTKLDICLMQHRPDLLKVFDYLKIS
jgi:hypothetical protein